jgi:hypothetical protein
VKFAIWFILNGILYSNRMSNLMGYKLD